MKLFKLESKLKIFKNKFKIKLFKFKGKSPVDNVMIKAKRVKRSLIKTITQFLKTNCKCLHKLINTTTIN